LLGTVEEGKSQATKEKWATSSTTNEGRERGANSNENREFKEEYREKPQRRSISGLKPENPVVPQEP